MMSRVGSDEQFTAGENVDQSIYLVEHLVGLGQIKYKHMSYYPAVLILGIYPKEILTKFHKRTSMRTFIMALLVVTENWKQFGWQLEENIDS